MNTSKQPTFLRRPDPQPEPFQYATLLTEGKRPLFTAHELRNLGYTALLTLGVILAPVELHREQIAHDEHRERDASARMLGWCFLVVGMCAFFALMALAYKEGWL